MSGWAGAVIATAVMTAATGGGLGLRRGRGRFRVPTAPAAEPEQTTAMSVPAADPVLLRLGVTPGRPVTLLQFSSAFCTPCRATRLLCEDVASQLPEVSHLEVDAESHLDEVRALTIWRTPTVLIVDSHGQVRGRATGAPTRAQLMAAIAAVQPDVAPVGATQPDNGR